MSNIQIWYGEINSQEVKYLGG